MPNQNECDHAVGLSFTMNYLSQIRAHKSHAWITTKFNYCPACGARIDWEKIEEMVKDEN